FAKYSVDDSVCGLTIPRSQSVAQANARDHGHTQIQQPRSKIFPLPVRNQSVQSGKPPRKESAPLSWADRKFPFALRAGSQVGRQCSSQVPLRFSFSLRHVERSRDIPRSNVKAAQRDSSTALGMTNQ